MRKIITLPNLLSFARIILTPVFVLLFFGDVKNQILAILIFTIAALTDAYDGYFARKNQIITKFGTFIDPLADKVLVLSTFSIFAYIQTIGWWVVIILALRDLIVTQLRIILLNAGNSLATSKMAKLKTIFQFVGIYLLFLSAFLHNFFTNTELWSLDLFVKVFIYGLVIFSGYTCVDYIVQYAKIRFNIKS
jgi:CDP-diacylglycerol--glycerol-3-phosphate 3-phosphatidyltransferase